MKAIAEKLIETVVDVGGVRVANGPERGEDVAGPSEQKASWERDELLGGLQVGDAGLTG